MEPVIFLGEKRKNALNRYLERSTLNPVCLIRRCPYAICIILPAEASMFAVVVYYIDWGVNERRSGFACEEPALESGAFEVEVAGETRGSGSVDRPTGVGFGTFETNRYTCILHGSRYVHSDSWKIEN